MPCSIPDSRVASSASFEGYTSFATRSQADLRAEAVERLEDEARRLEHPLHGGEERGELLQRDGQRLGRSRRPDRRYDVIALRARRDRHAREAVLGERVTHDVRSATDASEGARRRIEIDDQAIRMKEIGGTRG